MKVFISHAHTDEALVEKVATALNKAGLEAWDDTREIFPGDNWADKIAQALKESEAMVVLLTPDAIHSSLVRHDVAYALGNIRYRNRLLPVIVGDPDRIPKEDIPWILHRLKMVQLDEHTENEEGIKQIAETLLNAV
jgi:hypothetical protein